MIIPDNIKENVFSLCQNNYRYKEHLTSAAGKTNMPCNEKGPLFFFKENKSWHFMWIIYKDDSHEKLRLICSEKELEYCLLQILLGTLRLKIFDNTLWVSNITLWYTLRNWFSNIFPYKSTGEANLTCRWIVNCINTHFNLDHSLG